MKSHVETIIVIELEKNEIEAFKNLNQLSEDSDISFIDIEIIDNNTNVYQEAEKHRHLWRCQEA